MEQEASVAGHWTPVAALRITAQVGQSHDNELDTLDGVEPAGNLFDTTRNTASLQADWTIVPKQIVTLGSDYLKGHYRQRCVLSCHLTPDLRRLRRISRYLRTSASGGERASR